MLLYQRFRGADSNDIARNAGARKITVARVNDSRKSAIQINNVLFLYTPYTAKAASIKNKASE